MSPIKKIGDHCFFIFPIVFRVALIMIVIAFFRFYPSEALANGGVNTNFGVSFLLVKPVVILSKAVQRGLGEQSDHFELLISKDDFLPAMIPSKNVIIVKGDEVSFPKENTLNLADAYLNRIEIKPDKFESLHVYINKGGSGEPDRDKILFLFE